jgi:parallel beta-helix repeat protein
LNENNFYIKGGERLVDGNKGIAAFVVIVFLGLLIFAGEVGAATNVSSCLTIGFQGTYVLNQSLSNSSPCITIESSDVILDGAGFTIDGIGSGNGIYYKSGTTLTNITLRNLVVTDWSTGIWYRDVQEGSINNNNASSNINGIQLSDSSDIILQENDANFNRDSGIKTSSSNSNTLVGNNASGNREGIWITVSSTNNVVAGNNASSNGFGIRISSANGNLITNNIASSNTQHGLYLVNSNNNILTGNTAENNNRGITVVSPLSPSGNNNIYNNYFNNTVNSFITTQLANTWNTAKTLGTNIIGGPYLGGNFWGKPDGTGFSQTCTDTSPADGLCDSSYSLAAGNVDNLPLAMSANNPPVINSIDPDLAEPQPNGTTITWTCNATDEEMLTLRYRFALYGPATQWKFTTVRGWNTSPTWSWNTDENDIGLANRIKCFARDESGEDAVPKEYYKYHVQSTVPNNPPVINSIDPDLAEPQPNGTTITWTCNATDEYPQSLLYRFVLKTPATGTKYKTVRSYSTSNQWTWQTTNSHVTPYNSVKCWVKDSLGVTTAWAYKNYEITP